MACCANSTYKGTIFRNGKPVEIFEARGVTLPVTTKAAWAKAEEIVKQLRTAERPKTNKRVMKKQ